MDEINIQIVCKNCNNIINIKNKNYEFCNKKCEEKYRAKILMSLKSNWIYEEYQKQNNR